MLIYKLFKKCFAFILKIFLSPKLYYVNVWQKGLKKMCKKINLRRPYNYTYHLLLKWAFKITYMMNNFLLRVPFQNETKIVLKVYIDFLFELCKIILANIENHYLLN